MKITFEKQKHKCKHCQEELELIKNDCAHYQCEKPFYYCRKCGLKQGDHL